MRGVHWQARRTPWPTPRPARTNRSSAATSAEFTEYRLYRQGDDPRRLDWRLLARSDRAYIRLATDRAVLPTTIVLDASASMAFPVGDARASGARAQELAVGLAAVAHADGDPVGVAVHEAPERVRVLPPRTRRGVVGEIARVVERRRARRRRAARAGRSRALRTSRIAIVTDLLGDADELLRAARVHVVAGGEVHLVHVVAREEIDPPRRPILAADPEAAGDAALARRARRAPATSARSPSGAREMARAWRAAGAAYTEVVTDEPAAHAVRRIAERPAAAGAAMSWLIPSALGIAGGRGDRRRRAALHRAQPPARRAAADGALRSATADRTRARARSR